MDLKEAIVTYLVSPDTQKNATPTTEQAEAIRRAGYDPAEWVVARALVHIMFIRHRKTREVKRIRK